MTKTAQRWLKQLEAINQIANKIGTSLNLQETLDAVISAVAELIPSTLAEISLWDKERQLLILSALRCTPERSFPLGYTFPPGKGYTGWVVRHKSPLFVPDIAKRQDIKPDLLPGEKPFRSYIGLPLIAGEELVGTLVLIHEEAEAFTQDDVGLVETLAGYAAVAIHKARLYEELSHRHQELEALYSIAATLNRPLNLEKLMQQALTKVIEVTRADGGAIRLLDKEERYLLLATHQGLSENYIRQAERFPLSEEIVGWVARQRKPSLSQDMWSDPRVSPHIRELLKEVGHRALAQVPLIAQDRVVGTLGLVSRTAGFFSQDDLQLLNAIGQQLGMAIANAQLFEEIQQRAQRLAALNAMATVISQALDMDSLLKSAAEKIIEVTRADGAVIALFQPEVTKELQVASAGDFSPGFITWYEGGYGGQKGNDAFFSPEKPMVIGDVKNFSFSEERIRSRLINEGIRAWLRVPLLSGKKVVGSIDIAFWEPQNFGKEDIGLLQAIGHQLGTAIDNARLRQEAIQSERLVAVGRVASTVVHDLKGPLSGIINSADFLARPNLSPQTRKKMCEGIMAAARRLISTVQGILDYTREGRMTISFAACSLPDFLQEIINVFQVDFEKRRIKVDLKLAYRGELKIDADKMAQVIHNILANARDALAQGGQLIVSAQKKGNWLEIFFDDSGPGVPPELKERIFEPFFSYHKKKGAGLGLSIARRIVEEHGGRIWVEEGTMGGARFIISLPLM
ncbi:MAG: GAF domain-containing protein [Candidatus Aminicenantes bacterium]|nr:GAF domain-containing protein [Candidatus Aminicenantes bacterium]